MLLLLLSKSEIEDCIRKYSPCLTCSSLGGVRVVVNVLIASKTMKLQLKLELIVVVFFVRHGVICVLVKLDYEKVV